MGRRFRIIVTIAFAAATCGWLSACGGGRGGEIQRRGASIALSPSGAVVALGVPVTREDCFTDNDNSEHCEDHVVGGAVRLFSARTGSDLTTFTGHGDNVNSVAYSSDGSLLASASLDRTVRLWDVHNASLLRTIGPLSTEATSISFSPDSRFLAGSQKDGSGVRLWDTPAVQSTRTLSTGGLGSLAVAFSPDGKTLAGGAGVGIILWNTQNWTTRATLSGHTLPIQSISFSPDSSRVVSGSLENGIRVWDSTTGGLIRLITSHDETTYPAVYSPDGSKIAAAGYVKHIFSISTSIKLFDANSGTLIREWDHPDGVLGMVYEADNRTLMTLARDGRIRLYDTSAGSEIAVLN